MLASLERDEARVLAINRDDRIVASRMRLSMTKSSGKEALCVPTMVLTGVHQGLS